MIPNLFKKLLLLHLLCFPMICFSQKGFSENWETITQHEYAQIEARRINCPDSSNGVFYRNIVFRIRNLSSSPIRVSWNYKPWINGEPIKVDVSDTGKLNNFHLQVGETVEGRCGEQRLCEYQSFIDKPEVPALTGFELVNFSVTLNPDE